jgi:hypothetical protein
MTTEGRAKALEEGELAFRVKMLEEPVNKMEPAPENKAAAEGPLGSAGGETGEEETPPSSPPDPPPRQRRSSRYKRTSSRS